MACTEGLAFRKTGNPVSQSSVHKMQRNPIYLGEFVWDGKTHEGNHETLVSRELWGKALAVLNCRYANGFYPVSTDS